MAELTPEEIYRGASTELLQIVLKVMQIEKDHLYERLPRGINDELLKMIKKEASE